jgi:hypothetical protein
MSFASSVRESRRDTLIMLETHIIMSLLIFRLVLILMLCLVLLLVLSHFFPGPNDLSYNFGSRENSFVPGRFGYDPCSHRGDRFPRRHGFLAGGSYTHFDPRYLDGTRFPRRGSHTTGSKVEVQKTVKTSSDHMVKCWIHKIYLTNPNTEPLTSSRPMQVMDGSLENT